MGSVEADLVPQNNSSQTMNPMEFKRQGHTVIDFIANNYQNIEKYLIYSQVEPGYLRRRLPRSASNAPELIARILQDVQEHIVPGITDWLSPNYFAHFPSSGNIVVFLGEMLSTGFNVVGFNWISSPAATELEHIVMDWLGDMLQLPRSFLFSGNGGGVIHETTSELSHFVHSWCCWITKSTEEAKEIEEKRINNLHYYKVNCSLNKT
ncbi:hypothetical protein K2173_006639 [Erythroxylum novogranatense]|uniref:Tyrosine decarboxylase n=1 Tax=Erythroxylum novogranatense TaxID=1862640 RepID=A0AAV8T5H8_9ROSI|nr:hypothetical protein K2173_006639 [Erythroxylum novogranatense]